MPTYNLTLAQQGRTILLHSLFQYRTYSCLLEGFPYRKLNRELVHRALEYAREKLWGDAEPFLIEPVERPMQLKDVGDLGDDPEPVKLPDVVCLGDFESNEPARDRECDCSSLKIVWFQDAWAFPIDPEIERRIVGMDWNACARDGLY